MTEGKGIPLALVVAGANRNDMKLLGATLEAIVVVRPDPCLLEPQHLCGDKGYDYPSLRKEVVERQYIPHIRSRGEDREEKRANPQGRARRWVVEVCHSWLNRFRKILVRFEKKLATHLGLLQFACAYIALKRSGIF